MLREVVIDTETTGFDFSRRDRIVEIGAVELINHLPTGDKFHAYINPQRDVPKESFVIHGLNRDFLRQFPTFKKVGPKFVAFVGQAKLVAHNARFDLNFLNAEFRRAGMPGIDPGMMIDTLELSMKVYPGARHTLDSLCNRFKINREGRQFHGALLDAELLASVYIELLGGRQYKADLVAVEEVATVSSPYKPRPSPLPSRLTDEEIEAHKVFIETQFKVPTIWGEIWNEREDGREAA